MTYCRRIITKILEILKGNDSYHIYKVNVRNDILLSMFIGLIVSIVVKLCTLLWTFLFSVNGRAECDFDLIKFIFTFFITSTFSFFIKAGFLNSVNKKISDLFDIKKGFFDLLNHMMNDLGRPSENEDKLKETSYFLKVNNARTGDMLSFSPDNESINMLHKVTGMISVTQASPFEWLNPTYSFFLVNNYIASVSQSILKKAPINSIKFSKNREEENFVTFEQSKRDILCELSKLGIGALNQFLRDNKIFIRFYILGEDELVNNKSIIETLIAGHDLFGCYMYFINRKFYDSLVKDKDDAIIKFYSFLHGVQYNHSENKEKIDLAVACCNGVLNVIHRKNGELRTEEIKTADIGDFESFISRISGLLHSNYDEESHLFVSYFKRKNFSFNEEFCHIIYNQSETA